MSLVLVGLLASGCVLPELNFLKTQLPQPTVLVQAATPTPSQPVASPTSAVAPPQNLTIWLPPQFDPSSGNKAAKLFLERISAFETEHPGVSVDVRVKASGGSGGLLEALAAASAAAPAALPAIVALSRPDLETAALKGLILPLEGRTTIPDENDWYPYAHQMAFIQKSPFGLPFAGDALLLVYRPAQLAFTPTSWAEVFATGRPLAFSAADPQALLTLTLYLTAGGKIQDAQLRPMLDVTILTQVLQQFAQGTRSGAAPFWLQQYQTDAQVWQAYLDQRTQWAVTWSSHYLSELPADSTAVPLPSIGKNNLTIATGWSWAMADPIPARQSLSLALMEYLTDPAFLSKWSAVSGYLPTRPSALTSWSDKSLQSLAGQVAISAQLRPTNDLLSSLGPALQDATLQVIKRLSDPAQAAQAALEKLIIPPPQ